jgi:tetratricopeptide (TPR) repeat protein
MLDEEGLSEDSTPIWKMLCYQPGKDSRPLAAYSYPAYSGLANIVFRDAQKGDPGWVESFLGYMLADNNDWYLRGSVNSMHPVSLLLNFREQVNQSKAHRAFKDGKPAVAVRYLERALRARPGNVDNVVAFVEQLTSAGAEDEMDVLFDISRQLHVDVLNTFPKSAMHHNNFAWLCAKANKNIDEGLSHSLKATELRPHEDTYWDTLAEVYFQKGDYQKALELAKRCVLMDPLYPHYRDQLKKYEAVISAQ